MLIESHDDAPFYHMNAQAKSMEQWATTQEPKWWITAAELCLIGETMREG
jgi:hypothetical protein